MLSWAFLFLFLAIVAAIIGFGGLVVAAAGIAKALFFIFLVLFVAFMFVALLRRPTGVSAGLRRNKPEEGDAVDNPPPLIRFVLYTMLLAGLAFPSAADTVEAAKSAISDAVITARIETVFLFNNELSALGIDVSTEDGVVTLTGAVGEPIDKELAESLAETVDGVTAVINNLKIEEGETSEKEKSAWKKELDEIALETRIRRQLAYHSGLKSALISVDADGAVVTLDGVVDSADKKDEIERLALETAGVDSIVSTIRVKTEDDELTEPEPSSIDNIKTTLSDEWVEKRIENAVLWNRHLSLLDLDIEVEEGVCVLTGTTISKEQKDLAGSVASKMKGVKDVVNKIKVVRPST